MGTILKAENISKQYRLGTVGTGTLSHDLNRWWHTMRGKEDPYLKVGAVNDRSGKATEDYVWALRDIDFDVKTGEALGIIGKNGAGKSTLLKILSRVTAPTTGSIKTKGRIASLLEVGTGFHPELTGRENIFMNGAVLGMTRAEIKNKLDEIIAFSGCERYIDTPVKRYSSGMTVRLGFAVAAHLEPEILVVDEVLAVGDAEFQKKAIGKMQDLSQGEGRTVLFVSHNMASVKKICDRGILLENGLVRKEGDSENVINFYLTSETKDYDNQYLQNFIENQNDDCFILNELSVRQNGLQAENFYTNKELELSYDFSLKKEVLGLRIGFDLINLDSGLVIFRSFHDDNSSNIKTWKPGKHILETKLPSNILKEGKYAIKLAVGIHNVRWIIFEDELSYVFNLYNIDGLNKAFTDTRPGVIMPALPWSLISTT